VAMVDSPQTARFYRASGDADAPVSGMYQALMEARIPFEMAHERFLDQAHVDRYRLLILPNVAALSDSQCKQLADFVRRGGSLLATYETSLYDEWGVKRRNFGLADLFGVNYRGQQGPMRNSYARIESAPDGSRHPLVAGFDGAERIVNSVYRLEVDASGASPHPPLTLIPPYPDLPMEQLFPRVARTDTPLVYARQIGEGRVVYFPGDWDSTFWQFLLEDHARLLKNAILWAANEEPPVSVSGPGLLDVTVWRQPDSMTVHLVNLSNPMAMRGYFREFLPVGPLRLRIRLPDAGQARQVRFLVGADTPVVQRQPGFLTLTVPNLLSHEVVAVDL
jgi:Beta-galactosidase trimerisation domain